MTNATRLSYRSEILRAIETRLRAPLVPEVQGALDSSSIPRFATARDLVTQLIEREPRWPQRDAALLALLRVAQGASDAKWEAVLLVLASLRKELDALYATRVWLGVDGGDGNERRDECWSIVQEAFQRAVAKYPIDRRKRYVAWKLEGLVKNELAERSRIDQNRELARALFEERAVPLLRNQPAEDDGAHLGLWDFYRTRREETDEAPPDDSEIGDAATRLDEFLSAEVVDELDRRLLIAHHAEGRSIPELARTFGMTKGAVKGRLCRARWRARRYCGVMA